MLGIDNLRKVPVKIPYKSGFNKSYRHTLTGETGSLTPIFVDEIIPNEDIYLRCPFSLRLPPLATDTFMNISYKMEAFFVPSRLLMRGYDKFMTGQTKVKYGDNTYKVRVPVISFNIQDKDDLYRSLLDYLGVKSVAFVNTTLNLNALPILGYHLIYNEWYRNSLVQKSIFSDSISTVYSAATADSVMPSSNPSVGYTLSVDDTFADSVGLLELRQRNFGADYFTVATPTPQNGPAIGVKLTLDTTGFKTAMQTLWSTDFDDAAFADSDFKTGADQSIGDDNIAEWSNSTDINPNFTSRTGITANQSSDQKFGGFSIASLRAANSLQIFLERNNIAGNRFVDFLRANYGADLKDGVAQRPVYLGSASYPVYTNGVMANGEPNASGQTVNNPFNTVGSTYGHAVAEGKDFVIKAHFDEPGYLYVIGSLVPEVTYSTGIDKMFRRYVREDSRTDMANHLLQNVGPQPIYQYESTNILDSDAANSVFGYVDRYADFMVKRNTLSGLLHDGESLESFALQRSLGIGTLSTSFLQIPKSFLNQVMAVTDANSGFTYWLDVYFDYRCSMPLARYSIPSLQDPAYEHGDTVWLNRGGVRID